MIRFDQDNNFVRYTARDFQSIRDYIIEYARRYYPNVVNDFRKESFNAMIIDIIALIGDSQAFYQDFSANELFLKTALTLDDILKHAWERNYKPQFGYSAVGEVSLYVSVPAQAGSLSPDYAYAPTLRQGSIFASADGASFLLAEDVSFQQDALPEVRVGTVSPTTGTPLTYVLKRPGKVISGEVKTIEKTIGDYQPFVGVTITDPYVVEIMSVFDSDGSEYFEVNNLTQNTIYKQWPSVGGEQMILKPVVVARRFVAEYGQNSTTLRFGGGSDGLQTDYVNMPENVALQFTGKNYISDTTMDPTQMIRNDRFGVAPANTTLTITYRVNASANMNVGVGQLRGIVQPTFSFVDELALQPGAVADVRQSLSVTNEDPVTGSLLLESANELKQRILGHTAAQDRAVTTEDYRAAVYAMPAASGGVKRCNVTTAVNDALQTVVCVYAVAQDAEGKLGPLGSFLQDNMKTWLKTRKMAGDTVYIFDAYVVNFGVDYTLLLQRGYDRYRALTDANAVLAEFFQTPGEVGESFSIAAIYDLLNNVTGVVDTTSVRVYQKKGGLYSTTPFDVNNSMSGDGLYVTCPKNVIFEVRYPEQDIQGSIR